MTTSNTPFTFPRFVIETEAQPHSNQLTYITLTKHNISSLLRYSVLSNLLFTAYAIPRGYKRYSIIITIPQTSHKIPRYVTVETRPSDGTSHSSASHRYCRSIQYLCYRTGSTLPRHTSTRPLKYVFEHYSQYRLIIGLVFGILHSERIR